MKQTIKFGIIAAIIIIAASAANSFPTPPSTFYGNIFIDGEFAKAKTIISVYDEDDTLCGSQVIEEIGNYLVSCRGDDPLTSKDEGAKEDENIFFAINNQSFHSVDINATWKSGRLTKINLFFSAKNESITPEIGKRDDSDIYLISLIYLIILIFVIHKLRIS